MLDDHLLDRLSDEIQVDNKQELLDAALSVFDELTPQEIEIIDMKYFQQRPNREVADILDIKEGNLKVKAHRIIKKIEKLIYRKHGTV